MKIIRENDLRRPSQSKKYSPVNQEGHLIESYYEQTNVRLFTAFDNRYLATLLNGRTTVRQVAAEQLPGQALLILVDFFWENLFSQEKAARIKKPSSKRMV
ncbi:MAG: hypothetical protein WCV56_01840 [Candidatus Omnitrophota bacterium]